MSGNAGVSALATDRKRSMLQKADTNKDDLKSQEKQPIGSLKQDTVQSKLFCAVFFYVQMY